MEEERITSGEFQAILSAITEIQKVNQQSHDDLRELIHESIKGVGINIDATIRLTNLELKKQNDHFATLNGNVARLQRESDERKIVVEDFRRLERNLGGIKKKWVYILAGLVGLILAVLIVYDVVGLSGIIEMIK
ncbi:MAG: hypothetical protein JXM68_12100 [Sedimentisphaerales bacterium]|nr:hypothetical protein [Sedimentisphaerales bacterium]